MTTETTQLTLSDLTGDYVIDQSHSRVGFVARHMMVAKVRGVFNEFSGTLKLDGDNPSASSGEVNILAGSIDTNSEQRDAHIRSGDFLADGDHGGITFKTTSVEGDNEDFQVSGDLTIRGESRPVTFEVKLVGYGADAYGNIRVGFEGRAVVNRHDWDVSWNAPIETGGVVVGDKVTLEFEFSAVKQ